MGFHARAIDKSQRHLSEVQRKVNRWMSGMQDRMRNMAEAVALSYVLCLGTLAMHEVAHLVVLYAMGGTGALLIVPWRLGSMNHYIYGLHVEPSQPLTVANQALLNFLGPVLATVPLGFLLYFVRDRIPRISLISNILILVFFALLESSYELLESALNRDIGILGSPEFNIGVPILIILFTAYRGVWKKV